MTTTCTRHEWNAPDGETFPYSVWEAGLPAGERPRAVVVAVHGLSGAALDYEPLGRHVEKHGIVTVALELRGQGNDPRVHLRGDLAQIEDWFMDLRAFFSLIRSRYPDAPLYYYGESMGAALLIRFLAQATEIDQPAGLILASPVVALRTQPPLWQELLFRFFLGWRPGYRINIRKLTHRDSNDPSKWVTRDEAHRRWFETAPHKLDFFTVRFLVSLRDLIGGCPDDAPKIHVPVLVIYAANDVFILPTQVEQFFARLGSREKELRFFPEAYHLLLHDHDSPQALERIEAWLQSRLDAPVVSAERG